MTRRVAAHLPPPDPAAHVASRRRSPGEAAPLDDLLAQALRAAEHAGPSRRATIHRLLDLSTRIPTIDTELLDQALSADSSAVFLLRLADGLSGPPTDPRSQYHAALRRGAEVRHEILARDGGALTADDAAQLLGLKTRQAIYTQIAERRLLSVPAGGRKHLIPAWQFRNGQIVPGLHEVLAALPGADPWWHLLFFVGDNIRLGNRRPLDLLLAGEVDAVVSAARVHGAGGW